MKGILFSQIKTEENWLGALKKVYDQIETLRKAGIEMTHKNFHPVEGGLRKTRIQKGIMASIPWTYVFSKYAYDHEYDGYDFYYFRFEASDYWFSHFIKKLKKNNPRSKIIVEFPDYPYLPVLWKSPIFVAIRLKDYWARALYSKYVDRFVVWNQSVNEIYGVKVLHYQNGIDVDRIPIRIPVHKKEKAIHMICVSTMFPFHGTDRLIRGMASYYAENRSENIVLHLIGDGPGNELRIYKTLIDQYGLGNHIIIEGRKTGDELDKYFNISDIAIGSLGMYRVGIEVAGSLKIREYLSRGIPIVTGGPVDILQGESFEYSLVVPNDDSDIDVDMIVRFWYRIYNRRSREQVVSEIRGFAEQKCDFSVTFKEVIDYVMDKGESCN